MDNFSKINHSLFPVLVKTYDLHDYNTEEFTKIPALIDNESKIKNGLIENGDRSKSNFFLKKLPNLQGCIQKCIDDYTSTTGLLSCKISYSWCNVYRKAGHIRSHRHEMSLISGVFYPKIYGDGGVFAVDNPCNPFKVNEISEFQTEYNRQNFELGVVEGMLIIFPSWLMHYTVNNTADLRYIISFDTIGTNYDLVN